MVVAGTLHRRHGELMFATELRAPDTSLCGTDRQRDLGGKILAAASLQQLEPGAAKDSEADFAGICREVKLMPVRGEFEGETAGK